MARKIANYTVKDEGRDKGKLFLITEMSVTKIEAWAMRALMGLLAANVELPNGFENLGMAALAEMGFKALGGLKWELLEPLLAEMLTCVQVIPDPKKTNIVRDLTPDYDIEEVLTLLQLRMEVWNLHAGFLKAAGPSLVARAKAAAKNISSTKTSHT